jgi:hypothetical protein
VAVDSFKQQIPAFSVISREDHDLNRARLFVLRD